MSQTQWKTFDPSHRIAYALISRRAAVGCSGLAVLGLLSGAAFEQEKKGPDAKLGKEGQEKMEEFHACAERMRIAGPEERMKIMEERRAQEHRRAIEDFKDRLRVSDNEWAVVKPRIEKVDNLMHPLRQMRTGSEPPRNEVERRSRELRELLRDEGAAVDKIKAGLIALRAAKEQATRELVAAKRDLRQLMTLRQEAELVLSGLLD